MKFLVLGDFHYKKGMYASTVADLDEILQRAYDEDVDFVIHTGDFCNDYVGSPEILKTYLDNKYNIPVFGIYGNHELETRNNNMAFTTAHLCNRAVEFGGADTGYWHYDFGEYRLVGLDTNYSFNEEVREWQHNLPASWGPPQGNKNGDSIAPEQLKWLDGIIAQAYDRKQKVVVFSHTGLSGEWASSPDAKAVREIFEKYKGTVSLCVNGHLHTEHFCVKDGIPYFDVNACINGYWRVCDTHHYTDSHTFTREKFAEDGSIIGTEEVRLNTLTQSKNTWFFASPLSAVVEIKDNGELKITGAKTTWRHGLLPPVTVDCIKPEISDRIIKPL